MSDFDEEAERRRLREKYEKDEERRKETQQMSELLLKGATMTNQHCGECGSPIFRYDGQEFCPSCQRVAGEAGTESDAGSEAASAESAEADEAAQSTPETPQQGDQRPGEPSPTPDANAGADSIDVDAVGPVDEAQDAGEAGLEASTMPERPGAAGQRDTDPGRVPGGTARSGSGNDPAESVPERRPESGATEASDVGSARAALLRALTRHAELAEATDDPRRAKDHLAAAREASEALDALDR
ncbi:Sjogren's syndrome/scleroderma autoantigen 1 family protein [Halobellus rubicundus]|uniref:Sjogren's syndrome/scleroderma autoantigen 1 family protein n=1 Tax=Halobellus rubicundus TaxID=2996466 RepID=A0ABD5M794_9EURY